VLTSALVQGSTISLVAEKLSLTEPERAEPMHSLELVSLGKANAEMIQYDISEGLDIVGKPIAEIPFPDNVLVNAIIRNGDLLTPSGNTTVQQGDTLFILASRKSKKILKQVLEKE